MFPIIATALLVAILGKRRMRRVTYMRMLYAELCSFILAFFLWVAFVIPHSPKPAFIGFVTAVMCLAVIAFSIGGIVRLQFCSRENALADLFEEMSVLTDHISNVSIHTVNQFIHSEELSEERAVLSDARSPVRAFLLFLSWFAFAMCVWSLLIVLLPAKVDT
jgi:hypothetical protein